MNTYYLGGTSMDLIKELNKERLEAEVTPVKVGDTVRVHVKVKEGSRERIQSSRAPSSPRSTAASPRPSPCAASPTVSVWRRSSPCTLPPSTRSRWSATVLCGVPSCTICTGRVGQGGQRVKEKLWIQDEREAKALFFLVHTKFPRHLVILTVL